MGRASEERSRQLDIMEANQQEQGQALRQVEAARATIGLATEAVKTSGGNVNAGYLGELAEAQAQAGLVGDARSTLRDILQKVQSGRYVTSYGPLSGILEVLLKMHDAALL